MGLATIHISGEFNKHKLAQEFSIISKREKTQLKLLTVK